MAMDIVRLNKQFGLGATLSIVQWGQAMPVIAVRNNSATALISLYGGQVLAFRPNVSKQELIYLSPKANWLGKKAIRGGIPLCWPWFGPDPEGLGRPNHGFARDTYWVLSETQHCSDFVTKLTLTLPQNEPQQKLWPYGSELKLTITVADELTLELTTLNTGDQAFTISQALHTYFNIGDIHQVSILGLNGHAYVDKVAAGVIKEQTGAVTFDEEVDRIYSDVHDALIIDDPVFERQIQIITEGSTSAIVWNPWLDKTAALSDLNDLAYRRFVCVESANAESDRREILPGDEHCIVSRFGIRTSNG